MASPSDRSFRLAAIPLLAAAIVVSLLSALSGGPLDALAGVPMLVVSIILVLGGSAGVEALVDWVEARHGRSPRAVPPRQRFQLPFDHSPALRLLVSGRRLRGPPAACSA